MYILGEHDGTCFREAEAEGLQIPGYLGYASSPCLKKLKTSIYSVLLECFLSLQKACVQSLAL